MCNSRSSNNNDEIPVEVDSFHCCPRKECQCEILNKSSHYATEGWNFLHKTAKYEGDVQTDKGCAQIYKESSMFLRPKGAVWE